MAEEDVNVEVMNMTLTMIRREPCCHLNEAEEILVKKEDEMRMEEEQDEVMITSDEDVEVADITEDEEKERAIIKEKKQWMISDKQEQEELKLSNEMKRDMVMPNDVTELTIYNDELKKEIMVLNKEEVELMTKKEEAEVDDLPRDYSFKCLRSAASDSRGWLNPGTMRVDDGLRLSQHIGNRSDMNRSGYCQDSCGTGAAMLPGVRSCDDGRSCDDSKSCDDSGSCDDSRSCDAVQIHKAVTAHFSSEQLLPSGFALSCDQSGSCDEGLAPQVDIVAGGQSGWPDPRRHASPDLSHRDQGRTPPRSVAMATPDHTQFPHGCSTGSLDIAEDMPLDNQRVPDRAHSPEPTTLSRHSCPTQDRAHGTAEHIHKVPLQLEHREISDGAQYDHKQIPKCTPPPQTEQIHAAVGDLRAQEEHHGSSDAPMRAQDQDRSSSFLIADILSPDFGSQFKAHKYSGHFPSHSVTNQCFDLTTTVTNETKICNERNHGNSASPAVESHYKVHSGVHSRQISPTSLQYPPAPRTTSSPGSSPHPVGTPKPERKSTVWPAWVYCTRYSDRPSSGEY